jgi:hypothetical protein
MKTTPNEFTREPTSRLAHLRFASLLSAATLGAALFLAACNGSARPNASIGNSTTTTVIPGTSTTGTGAVINPKANGGGDSAAHESSGSYTMTFAACMRAHGVPNFPNPNWKASQLGPNSEINPASPAFEAALSGPCHSMAPVGWVSSGPVTK